MLPWTRSLILNSVIFLIHISRMIYFLAISILIQCYSCQYLCFSHSYSYTPPLLLIRSLLFLLFVLLIFILLIRFLGNASTSSYRYCVISLWLFTPLFLFYYYCSITFCCFSSILFLLLLYKVFLSFVVVLTLSLSLLCCNCYYF